MNPGGPAGGLLLISSRAWKRRSFHLVGATSMAETDDVPHFSAIFLLLRFTGAGTLFVQLRRSISSMVAPARMEAASPRRLPMLNHFPQRPRRRR
jgi:hypothetical protein